MGWQQTAEKLDLKKGSDCESTAEDNVLSKAVEGNWSVVDGTRKVEKVARGSKVAKTLSGGDQYKKMGKKKNSLVVGVSSEAHKLYVVEENSTSGNRMCCGGDPAGSGKTLASCDVAETIKGRGSNL